MHQDSRELIIERPFFTPPFFGIYERKTYLYQLQQSLQKEVWARHKASKPYIKFYRCCSD